MHNMGQNHFQWERFNAISVKSMHFLIYFSKYSSFFCAHNNIKHNNINFYKYPKIT